MSKIQTKSATIALTAFAVLLVGLGMNIIGGISGFAAGIVYAAAGLILLVEAGFTSLSKFKKVAGSGVVSILTLLAALFLLVLAGGELFGFSVWEWVRNSAATGAIVAGAAVAYHAFMR